MTDITKRNIEMILESYFGNFNNKQTRDDICGVIGLLNIPNSRVVCDESNNIQVIADIIKDNNTYRFTFG